MAPAPAPPPAADTNTNGSCLSLSDLVWSSLLPSHPVASIVAILEPVVPITSFSLTKILEAFIFVSLCRIGILQLCVFLNERQSLPSIARNQKYLPLTPLNNPSIFLMLTDLKDHLGDRLRHVPLSWDRKP